MAGPATESSRIGDRALETRLRSALDGEVLFDAFNRGRYATDASIYQIEPCGVVVPRHADDIGAVLEIAREERIAVLPRGAGTSQCGQTVGRALVVDTTKHLNRIIDIDAERRRVVVEPGLVLDELNIRLKPHGLFFPVDISTGSRATLGGMAGNNSCGARSIRYGNMVHNVHAIETALASGAVHRFGPVPGNLGSLAATSGYAGIVQEMRTIAAREADEIAARIPDLLRRVGGYNIDSVSPAGHNMASLLVGSEGTLGFFTRLELDLQPIPPHKALGICRFGSLREAMAATKPIVELGPSAVELADRHLLDLARSVPLYRATIETFIEGAPEAVLLVEFSGEDGPPQRRLLGRLAETLADLGHPDSVTEVLEPAAQAAVWDMRKAGLNIVMSMKGDGKPISFVEDCAVALDDLPDYTDRLTEIFRRHGTHGTWYAHASVGCLHVRPVLNLKDQRDVRALRAIAEEAFAMVRAYRGSHSGEHGDGIVRSEFHEMMFGPRLVRAFEDIKTCFDPAGLFNPGKIVRPPAMDDRTLFRYHPGYEAERFVPALDWSAWGPGDSGFLGAVEMCNNNGACRKRDPGVMCPSFRATGDEQHVTRGRANTLRLALTGQLGDDALTSDAMAQSMALCIGCKGCKRECPTGVDMARMKIEVERQRVRKHGLGRRDRLIGWLPRYAPAAWRLRHLVNARNRSPVLRRAGEALIGFSARRPLPEWHREPFLERALPAGEEPEAVLLPDTFTTWFEPEIPRAALAVLGTAGYRVAVARPSSEDPSGTRPLCCGRTFLAAGAVDEARAEAQRTLRVLQPYCERGIPVIGLEPSCLFTLRDEWTVLLPETETATIADHAMTLEGFLASRGPRSNPRFGRLPVPAGLIHGHCHQKAFDALDDLREVLSWIPELDANVIESTCCGMAGAFGYQAETYDVSMDIGGLDLFPALDGVPNDALVIANGTSCRQQIMDGTGRRPRHTAEVLAASIATGEPRLPTD